MENYAKEIIARASEHEALKSVRSTLSTTTPQYRIHVDNAKVKAYNVEINEVYTTIQSLFGSVYVNDINLLGRNYKVNVQAQGEFREDSANYRDVFVKSTDGNFVPLSDLVRLERIINPSITKRFNMFPSAQILGETNQGYASGVGIKVMEQIASEVLPEGSGIVS